MGITTLLAEVALYAGTAAALSLTARGFRLYNLASGAWIVLGGWLWTWLISPAGTVSVDPIWFLLPAAIACLQVGLPWVLHRQLVHQQVSYVFATVGIALILDGAAPARLLTSYSAVIGIQGSAARDGLAVGVALVIAVLCILLMRSATYARIRVHFNFDGGRRGALLVAALLAGEIGLLFVLGAASSSVHHGLFSSSIFRGIVPVLALLLAQRQPVPAMLISGAVPAASYLLGKAIPNAAGISMPFVIGVLGCAAIAAATFSGARRAEGPNFAMALEQPGSWGLRNRNLQGFLLVVALGLVLQLGYRLDAPNAANTVWMMALAVSGMLVLGFVGAFTVSVPIIGALGAYVLISLGRWPLAMCAALVLLGVIWVKYMFILRAMQQDFAVVADLALMLGLGYFIMSSSAISGAEGIQLLRRGPSDFGATAWAIATLTCAVVAMFCVYLGSVVPIFRARMVGLLASEFGREHGAPVGLTRGIIMSLAAATAIAASFAYYSGTGSIAPSSMSLERGISVMVLASLMLRVRPIAGVLVVFALFTLMAEATSGQGTLVYAYLGLGLLIAACLPNRSKRTADARQT